MVVIKYRNQNVYTDLRSTTSERDLKKIKPEDAMIEEAYFFRLTPEREVVRMDFNWREIEAKRSGLWLKVKGMEKPGAACMAIVGWDIIRSFLNDLHVFGIRDAGALEGKFVQEYYSGILVGVGVEAR